MLDKRDKWRMTWLAIQLVVGAFFELVGISVFLPLIQVFTGETSESGFMKFMPAFFLEKNINDKIIILCIVLIMIYLLKDVFLAYSLHYQFKFIYDFQNRTRTTLLGNYINKPYIFHTHNNSADINRVLTSDVYNFSDYMVGLLQMISEIIVSICLVLLLAFSDFITTIVILLFLVVASAIYFIPARKALISNGYKNQKAYSEFVKCMNQSWGSIKEIKVAKCEKYFINIFKEASTKYAHTKRFVQFVSGFPRFLLESMVIMGIALAIIFKVSYNGEIADIISQLTLFAVAAYRLLPSVNRINAYYGMVNYNKASVDVVYTCMKESQNERRDKEKEGTNTDTGVLKQIEMKNITFFYPEEEKAVLSHVNINIKVGQSVGIVGKTGSGKTTLVDILLGLLNPQEGEVMFNGHSIYDNMDAWLDKVGYIPQKVYILDDTIRNNVAFGYTQDIDDNQIWAALKQAQMDEFVKGLEQGLDTTVGECGARLSGGQCQRLGIARVLYKKPEVIVLDESTSALDNETEAAVMSAIENMRGKMTLIIIAHRLSTIENCDIVYEVEDGKVIPKKFS